MTELSKVWDQIKWLHAAGISLIPVRDQPQGDYPAKTPYRGWKQYQAEQIPLPDLWGQMEQHKTEAVAIIAGEVSGNLEIIDIDVKYKPGIDATLFSDLKQLYPELLAKLRINKTPSGGYHILYRIESGEVPGNVKLAGRPATPAELIIRPKTKAYNFLETRGEGGYAVAPPSLGYKIYQDLTIPVISWTDRCSIINLCKSYSELVDPKPYVASKQDQSYYDENPFEHYNGSTEAETVLANYGWKFLKQSNLFIWFTRPDKDKGISASFNKQKRVYYIFTSSTEFEESKGYNPATVLSILEHAGDKKKTFRYLVQKGYGKIKPDVEARITKNNATAGRPLPPNASPEARANHAATIVTLQTTYPYGIFWGRDEEQKLQISREKLYTVAEGLGWRLHNNEPVQINGYVVSRRTERNLYDSLKGYIKEEDGDEYIEIANTFEAFIQRNGAFTITRLPYLDTSVIAKDTNNSAYKFYNNGYLFITATGYQFNTYDTLSGMIWEHEILTRPYNPGPNKGRYLDYLKLSTPYEEQSEHIRKVIGYLAHQYKDETIGYIIVLTEQCQDAKQGGGSGKNIFTSLFSNTTTVKSIPGSQISYDAKFMQSWNGERVFVISDVPKKFDFMFLKEPSTGSAILKKLFKDEVVIGVQDMCKFVVNTNYSYEVTDGGLRRRLIPIEFTDYFTKKGGVDVEFGVHFPKGWELQDWTGFDNFIATCVQEWLACGLKLYAPALTESGWHKQFEQTWGQVVTGIIEELLEYWQKREWVSNQSFKDDIDLYFRDNNTPMNYRPAMSRILDGIKEWCNHKGFEFNANILHRNELGSPVKHKWFGKNGDIPF